MPDLRLEAIDRLAAAREADQNGRFAQAVQLYEEYLAMGAVASESRDVAPYLEKLKKFVGHLEAARLALEGRDLSAARSGYLEALRLRPSSGFARAGLAEVEALLRAPGASTTPAPLPAPSSQSPSSQSLGAPPPGMQPEALSLTRDLLFADWRDVA